MKDLNDEGATREIIRNSYVDLADPQFKAATMDKILSYNRRRRLVNAVLVNIMVFIVTDALIWLGLKLTGLGVTRLVNRAATLLDGTLLRPAPLASTIGVANIATYMFLTLCVIAAALTILEFKTNVWKASSRRDGSIRG